MIPGIRRCIAAGVVCQGWSVYSVSCDLPRGHKGVHQDPIRGLWNYKIRTTTGKR